MIRMVGHGHKPGHITGDGGGGQGSGRKEETASKSGAVESVDCILKKEGRAVCRRSAAKRCSGKSTDGFAQGQGESTRIESERGIGGSGCGMVELVSE